MSQREAFNVLLSREICGDIEIPPSSTEYWFWIMLIELQRANEAETKVQIYLALEFVILQNKSQVRVNFKPHFLSIEMRTKS